MMNPLPMHDQAMPAAEAAMAAHAQGKYWQMEEKLFDGMQGLGPEAYMRFAREIGLDVARFTREMESHVHRGGIQRQQALANRLGARGTPNFFLNGRKMPGAAPIDRFAARVEQEIARAEAAMREGRVPASEIYEHLTKNGAEELVGTQNDRPASAAIPGRPAIRQPLRPDFGPVDPIPRPREAAREAGGGAEETRKGTKQAPH